MYTGGKVTKQKIKRYIPLLVVIILFVFLVATKIKDEMNEQTITLTVPVAGTTIYLNNKKEVVTKKPNEEIVLSPKVGVYLIIAFRNDLWPWQKNFVLQKGEHYVASVFTVKNSPTYSLIPEYTLKDNVGIQNNAYKEIVALFNNIPKKQTSSNSFVSIEINPDGQNISAAWLKEESTLPRFFCKNTVCEETFLVLPASQPVRQISFYPDRDDRIIFSTGTTIWIIELDRNEVQNAQPLYTGNMPEFIQGPGDNLYVKDAGKIMLVDL